MHRKLAGLTRTILFALCTTALAQSNPLPVYTIDHQARVDGPADVTFLLDAPAGKHGFVQAADGHLMLDGKRFRMWGVNTTGWTKGGVLLPPKKDAEIFARELARAGVNVVRLQFLDLPDKQTTRADVPATYSPAGLIDSTKDDTQFFNPEQLDRMDYWLYQLKLNGIYIDFNLNVGRVYKKGDGVTGYDLIGNAKALTYIDPRIIELEKDYARKLLTHLNPYTKTEYRNEPAVAIVELMNENSVLEFWQRNWFRGELKPGAPRAQLDFTPYHKDLLTKDYNKYLASTYTPQQLTDIRKESNLQPGEEIPLLRKPDFVTAPKSRFYAEATFYTQLETRVLEELQNYLKKDLGVKSLVIGTNDHTYFIPGMPLLRSTQHEDIIDAHVYWQHPAIFGMRNTPMVNDPLNSVLVKLTRSTLVGKPFTVSEVNEPYPNEYGAEMIPLLAAYGAFQDWDAVILYSYEPQLSGQQQAQVGDHFDIAQDPVKMAQMPAAAMLFLRHDVDTARETIARTYSTEQINESMRLPQGEDPYYTPGFPLQLPLQHAMRIKCLDCEPTAHYTTDTSSPIRTDTGQLAWYTSVPSSSHDKEGLVTIDSPRSSALVGFVKKYGLQTSHLSADVKNDFAAITLTSMDGKPLASSGTMLLTTGGKVENTGSTWDERRTNYAVWGDPPTLIEPIKGYILLRQLDGVVGMTVTPLDGASRPLKEIPARFLEAGWEFPIGDVPTTQYLIRIQH
ncbi:hypothetical protein FTO74_14525 [Granulicella sp. WH15]|uniref:hypothetical protein n=1 Tax=Granulicella sp. WH15 TaxID=2602070 RepID=UPI001366FA1D|nr:hypothetical protein [Granulicella sp. WH15]QHN04445.1 hypothetical protein FTO74_14525 [Granulicella sp. WH15]